MIIMGKKRNNGGALAVIMKKLGQKCPDHESMKEKNTEYMEKVPHQDGAEQDHSSAYDQAADKMMEAFKSQNVSQLKEALKSFIQMAMQEK